VPDLAQYYTRLRALADSSKASFFHPNVPPHALAGEFAKPPLPSRYIKTAEIAANYAITMQHRPTQAFVDILLQFQIRSSSASVVGCSVLEVRGQFHRRRRCN
jgi:hypothetical protein